MYLKTNLKWKETKTKEWSTSELGTNLSSKFMGQLSDAGRVVGQMLMNVKCKISGCEHEKSLKHPRLRT